jgi:hypothetical protein
MGIKCAFCWHLTGEVYPPAGALTCGTAVSRLEGLASVGAMELG